MHEAAHVALGNKYQFTSGWQAVKYADVNHISDYARNDKEDVSETYVAWYALRVSKTTKLTSEQ